MERGRAVASGPTAEIVGQYLARADAPSSAGAWIDLSSVERTGSGVARVLQARYWSEADTAGGQPYPDGPLTVGLAIEAAAACTIPSLAVTLYDMQGTKLVNADTMALGRTLRLEPGTHRLALRIPELHLNPGVYQMGFWLAGPLGAIYDYVPVGFEVEVVALQSPGLGRDADRRRPGHLPARAGGFRLNRTARGHRPAMCGPPRPRAPETGFATAARRAAPRRRRPRRGEHPTAHGSATPARAAARAAPGRGPGRSKYRARQSRRTAPVGVVGSSDRR